MTQARLLVTGSRTWPDQDRLGKALEKLYNQLKAMTGEEPILIQGQAHGADLMAAEAWIQFGGDIEAHPADWDKWGKQAGFIRNKEMVDSGADLCIAFIHNDSRGATQCAKLARRAGIKTVEVRIND